MSPAATAPLLPVAPPGAPPGEGPPRGAPPEGAPFASTLSAEQARTAIAEGHQHESRREEQEAERANLRATAAVGQPAASSQPPASQPSAGQPAAGQPPASQPPASQPPASQPPASQPPASQPPASQAAADKAAAHGEASSAAGPSATVAEAPSVRSDGYGSIADASHTYTDGGSTGGPPIGPLPALAAATAEPPTTGRPATEQPNIATESPQVALAGAPGGRESPHTEIEPLRTGLPPHADGTQNQAARTGAPGETAPVSDELGGKPLPGAQSRLPSAGAGAPADGTATAGSAQTGHPALAAGSDQPTPGGSRPADTLGSTSASTFAAAGQTAGAGLRTAIRGTAGATTQHPHPALQPSDSTARPAAAGALAAHDSRAATNTAPGLDASTPATSGESGLAAATGTTPGATAPGERSQAPALDASIGLPQALDELDGTIQLAARQGLAQARIALHPAELGEIRIHLVQTADGLLARVTAGTSAVAQALAGAHSELRQSLTSLGLNLANLELGHHEQAAPGGATAEHGHDDAAGRGESSQRGTRTAGGGADDQTAAAPIEPQTVSPIPSQRDGALVNVLA